MYATYYRTPLNISLSSWGVVSGRLLDGVDIFFLPPES